MSSPTLAAFDFLVFTFLALMTVGIVLLEEWAVSQGLLPVRVTRRLVHMVVGLFVVIALITLESPIWLYVSALLALVVTVVSREKGWIRAIHEPGSRSIGTITFPLALLLGLIMFWFDEPLGRYPLAIAFSVVAVSDPLAALIGIRLKDHRLLGVGIPGRTLAGSAAFAASAWLIVGLWMTLAGSAELLAFDREWVWHMAALVAIVATGVEFVARKGWDNFFVVLAVVLMIVSVDSDESARFLGWCIGAAIVFAIIARSLKFLTTDGAVLTGIMGATILFLRGWTWIIPPLAFFVSASLVSVWANYRRGSDGGLQERGSRRDSVQVLSNGAVALFIILLNAVLPIPGAYWIFCGAFVAAAADTFSTEIGTTIRGVTRSIVTRKRVDPGTSGGVSLAGTVAALVGAVIVALASSLAAGALSVGDVLLISVAGFIGAIADSLFGATIQVRYMDPFGSVTDAAMSKGEANERIGGWFWVGNDLVNFLCTLAGAGFVAIVLAMQ